MNFSVNNNNIKDTAGIVKCSCGVLFMLFCFCYIYFIQSEILAKAQFVYSDGLTSYHSIMTPLIVAGVLQIIQYVCFSLLRLPQKFYALSYFPSCIVLAMLSNFTEQRVEHFYFGAWAWVTPLLLILYISVVMLIREFFKDKVQDKQTFDIIITPNSIILMALFIFVGSISENNDIYLYELKTERLVAEGDYEGALNVGERSLVSSPKLTQLRMYALVKQDMLAERIFDFPQYYGTEGLLPAYDTTRTNRVLASDIYANMGVVPGCGIKSVEQFLNIVMKGEKKRSNTVIDYYLCFQLLKKDLLTFERVFYDNYNPERMDVPRAYQEALLLKAEQDGDSLSYISQETRERYNAYKLEKAQYLSDNARRNKTRQNFGNTYWWYYENEK
ncbi:MAG: hypothetical protein J5663_05730 [Bacteroidaceae bacterium]|nr:hypothetical protein [Bacteroidaceae bacterium]